MRSFIFCLVVSLFSSAVAMARTMETYGDSLTAAFLANTSVTAAPTLSEIGKIYSDLAMFKISGERKYIEPYEPPQLGWPFALSKLLELPNDPIEIRNYAVTGAKTIDLIKQIGRHRAALSPTLAFFFIGHNDLCDANGTTEAFAAEYAQTFSRALAAWDNKHRDATAYFMPVGDVHRVFQTLQGYVWHDGPQKRYACEDSWTRYFPYCPKYARLHKEGKLVAFLEPKIRAMNAELDKLANEWDRKNNGNRYRYLKDLHDSNYQEDYFAVDCFHLSSRGQRALADQIVKRM